MLVDLLKETQKKGFDPFYKITVFTIILVELCCFSSLLLPRLGLLEKGGPTPEV